MSRKQPEKALQRVNRQIQQVPTSARMVELRGQLYAGLKDFQKAEESFRKAIALAGAIGEKPKHFGEWLLRELRQLIHTVAEAGEEGLQRQRQLTRIVAETGCRIVGPSSLGVVRTHSNMLLTANAAFAADKSLVICLFCNKTLLSKQNLIMLILN